MTEKSKEPFRIGYVQGVGPDLFEFETWRNGRKRPRGKESLYGFTIEEAAFGPDGKIANNDVDILLFNLTGHHVACDLYVLPSIGNHEAMSRWAVTERSLTQKSSMAQERKYASEIHEAARSRYPTVSCPVVSIPPGRTLEHVIVRLCQLYYDLDMPLHFMSRTAGVFDWGEASYKEVKEAVKLLKHFVPTN